MHGNDRDTNYVMMISRCLSMITIRRSLVLRMLLALTFSIVDILFRKTRVRTLMFLHATSLLRTEHAFIMYMTSPVYVCVRFARLFSASVCCMRSGMIDYRLLHYVRFGNAF